MLLIIPSWVTLLASLIVVGLALARGGGAERLVGALTLGNLIWRQLHPYVYGADLGRELAHDAAAAVLITAIALRADRYWTLACASACVISVVTEAAQMIAPVDRWAYGTAELTWYYVFLISLGWGAWRAPARRSARLQPQGA